MTHRQIPSYVKTVSDVTGSRSLNTVYTNQTGRPIFVFIEAYLKWGTVGDEVAFRSNIDNHPWITSGFFLAPQPRIPFSSGFFTQTFIVPVGKVYEVSTFTSATSSVDLNRWVEVY